MTERRSWDSRTTESLESLNNVLSNVDREERQAFSQRMSQLASSPRGELSVRLLGGILQNNDIRDLKPRLDSLRISANIRDFLDAEGIPKLINYLSSNQDKFAFQLAYLLANTPKHLIPDEVKNRFPRQSSNYVIEPAPENWYLCDSTEDKLDLAIEENSAVVVNKKMLLKFEGKPTALCVENFRTGADAFFVAGNYYSPKQALKDEIRKFFRLRLARVALQEGSWVLMRKCADRKESGITTGTLMEKAKKYVETVDFQLPEKIRGRTAKGFLNTYEEEF